MIADFRSKHRLTGQNTPILMPFSGRQSGCTRLLVDAVSPVTTQRGWGIWGGGSGSPANVHLWTIAARYLIYLVTKRATVHRQMVSPTLKHVEAPTVPYPLSAIGIPDASRSFLLTALTLGSGWPAPHTAQRSPRHSPR